MRYLFLSLALLSLTGCGPAPTALMPKEAAPTSFMPYSRIDGMPVGMSGYISSVIVCPDYQTYVFDDEVVSPYAVGKHVRITKDTDGLSLEVARNETFVRYDHAPCSERASWALPVKSVTVVDSFEVVPHLKDEPRNVTHGDHSPAISGSGDVTITYGDK